MTNVCLIQHLLQVEQQQSKLGTLFYFIFVYYYTIPHVLFFIILIVIWLAIKILSSKMKNDR